MSPSTESYEHHHRFVACFCVTKCATRPLSQASASWPGRPLYAPFTAPIFPSPTTPFASFSASSKETKKASCPLVSSSSRTVVLTTPFSNSGLLPSGPRAARYSPHHSHSLAPSLPPPCSRDAPLRQAAYTAESPSAAGACQLHTPSVLQCLMIWPSPAIC